MAAIGVIKTIGYSLNVHINSLKSDYPNTYFYKDRNPVKNKGTWLYMKVKHRKSCWEQRKLPGIQMKLCKHLTVFRAWACGHLRCNSWLFENGQPEISIFVRICFTAHNGLIFFSQMTTLWALQLAVHQKGAPFWK